MPRDFQTIQLQLAEHLRDPENNPPPKGLEPRRLAIYRRLFFNNIVNFITKTFPVLNKLYTEKEWRRLARSFYAGYTSHSPYFADIPKSFVEYLSGHHKMEEHDPPFLVELAHYEWAEFALSVADQTVDWQRVDPNGDLFDRSPLLSPLAWRFTYRWRVHQISPQSRPQTPNIRPTHLILCRRRDGKVHFILINDTTAALCEELGKKPAQTGRQSIENISKKLGLPRTRMTLENGLDLLENMRRKEVILGTAKIETG